MRTLTSTLENAQKTYVSPPLLKLTLTKTGETTRTYDISTTTNRLRSLTHIEQEWSQIANIVIQSDSALAALSLEGFQAVIGYGYNTSAGDELSSAAPLELVAQATNTNFMGRQTGLYTSFTAVGVFDMMSADKASASYNQEDTDTQTVKTLLTAIANATLSCFSHCKSYTITFDSEDSLIDSYIPADYFHVAAGESRLSAFRKLIRTTKCKARIEDDGEIHVFNPTISGATYDYEYNSPVTNHNFFEKGVRKRLVIPNRMIVETAPGIAPPYAGSATDADSYAALGRYIDSEPHYIRATSNSQCDAIATAMLQHLQVESERGHGTVPMNCGQEVHDYVKFTDSIASDTRTGNIGYIARKFAIGKSFSMEFRFGKLAAEMPFMSMAGGADPFVTWATWEVMQELVGVIHEATYMMFNTLYEDAKVHNWHVTKQLRIPEAYN